MPSCDQRLGIIYKHLEFLVDLPDVEFDFLILDSKLPLLTEFDFDELGGHLDAALATYLKARQYTTGYVVFLVKSEIAWKSCI